MPLQRTKPSTANAVVEGGLVALVEDGKILLPTLSTVSQKTVGAENEKVKKRREIPLLSMRLRSSDPSPPLGPVQAPAPAVVVSSSESPLSALLQPIFALFPPAQQPASTPTASTPTPGLAPAFELKPPSPTKDKLNADTKSRLLGESDDKDDRDEFVIYQPSSWTAKRKKPSAATLAYMLDWRTDPFGDSPVAVRGQRTKYPKQTALPLPKTKTTTTNNRRLPARKVKVPIPLDFGLQLGRREHWGSLASIVSEVSFASSSFSLGSGESSSNSSSNFHEQQLVTPLQGDEFDYYGGIMRMVETETELPYLNNHHRDGRAGEDDLAASLGIDLTTSPTRPIRDGLAKLQVQSPMIDRVPRDITEEEEEEQMDSPHTPLSPRSVPSDEDSDSD